MGATSGWGCASADRSRLVVPNVFNFREADFLLSAGSTYDSSLVPDIPGTRKAVGKPSQLKSPLQRAIEKLACSPLSFLDRRQMTWIS
jgi:hypothetical protein